MFNHISVKEGHQIKSIPLSLPKNDMPSAAREKIVEVARGMQPLNQAKERTKKLKKKQYSARS